MKLSPLALLVAFTLSSSCFAQVQNLGFGNRSEASRQANAIKASVSASTQASQLIAQDKGVNNGYGVGLFQGSGTPSAMPRRAQAANFGAPVGAPASKPFSGITNSPTVSPYMNLFNDSITGDNDFNYQTLVRPQLQQQQFNQQVQRQAAQLNQRMSALSARNDYNVTGNQEVMPTGHSATFRYHSRFYPALGGGRR
ncbi:hypothetical protein [Aeoliella sp. SH292]|uniref:hypothetical protein n=1 Tax=Aeoliella sp. SH292 TaxID=3454464 RepID=UPI003F95505E